MFALFKADIYRVFRKKGFYLYTLFCTLAFLALVWMGVSHDMQNENFHVIAEAIISMSPLLIGIFLYTLLYGDDIKSKNNQAVLGHGYSRAQIVLYKYLIFIFFTVLAYLYLYMLINLYAVIFSFTLSSVQAIFIKKIIVTALTVLSYAAITNIVAYASQSSSSSIVVFVLLSSGTINLLLSLLLGHSVILNIFGDMQIYLVESLISETLTIWNKSSISLNKEVIILFAYMIVNLILSIQVFKKKELEF